MSPRRRRAGCGETGGCHPGKSLQGFVKKRQTADGNRDENAVGARPAIYDYSGALARNSKRHDRSIMLRQAAAKFPLKLVSSASICNWQGQDNDPVLFKAHMTSGHGDAPGRFSRRLSFVKSDFGSIG